MAKLIKYCEGQRWVLDVPSSHIESIFPNGTTVEIMFTKESNRENIICNKIEW